jgi:hypothetical protein
MIFFTAIVAAALAAQQTHSQGSQSEPRLVQGLHRYANCLVQERTPAVREVLALDFRTPEYGRAMSRLNRNDRGCDRAAEVERSMRSSTLLFAGALSEAMLRRDLDGQALGPRVAYDPAHPAIEARNGGEVMAICVVRGDPAATSRLLATRPATPEETQALRAMSARLSGCVPAGSEARFTREALRAIIAAAAYRLVRHNQAGSQ